MKKHYIKPSIATMEIETTSIMAGSPDFVAQKALIL